MHTVHIDHLGPFITSTTDNLYSIAVVGVFTKFVLTIFRNILFIFTISETFGFPSRIISNRGSALTSKRFEDFCSERETEQVLTATATSRANGQVKSYNRTILSTLAACINDKQTWDPALSKVVSRSNNMTNKATRQSLSELLLGYRLRDAAETKILNRIGESSHSVDRNQAW